MKYIIGIIRSVIADLGYLVDNQKAYGLSLRNAKADLAYMVENIIDPTRERGKK